MFRHQAVSTPEQATTRAHHVPPSPRPAGPARFLGCTALTAIALQRCGDHPCPPEGCERDLLQRHATEPDAVPARGMPASAERAIRETGEPLDPAVRGMLEPRFGASFADVRVHTDASSTKDVAALAYTVGRHVVFTPGRYAPETTAGLRLLAHELTHVLQQRGHPGRPLRYREVGTPTGTYEREAEVISGRVTAGLLAGPVRGGVTRVEINARDRVMSFNGPLAHTWRLTGCDLSDGDYDATVERTRDAGGKPVVRFHVRNAPVRIEYHVEGRELNPYDAVRDKQTVRIHVVGTPTTGSAKPAAPDQGETRFLVSVVDLATFERSTGVPASALPEERMLSGASLRFGIGVPGLGFGLRSLPPYVPRPVDPFHGLFSERWAGGGAETYEAAAREAARRARRMVPPWAVSVAEQRARWQSVVPRDLTPQERSLFRGVLEAERILAGRGINIHEQGQFTLDEWLMARRIKWEQRWQDVYSRAVHARTSAGRGINMVSGGGYSAAEAEAAEIGARAGGAMNKPFWWDDTPRPHQVLARLPLRLRDRLGLGGVPAGTIIRGVLRVGGSVLLIYGVYSSASRIVAAPQDQRGPVAVREGGSWLGGWVGAAISSAVAGTLFCSEIGPGALICTGSFAIAGGLTGSAIGEHMAGEAAESALRIGELLRDPAAFTEAATQMFGTPEQRRQFYEDRELLDSLGW